MRRWMAMAFAFWMGIASAGDRLDVTGEVDLRWIHASGDPSYLNGGLGILRFDPDHEEVRLGRAFLASRLRLTDIVTLHTVIDAYADHDRNPVDLSEFYFEARPFPTRALRWRARVGAFFLPVSLENRGAGWSDVYSITPSALNTWIGEEFRTVGAEVEARWLGASTDYLGDFAFIAAAYGWNDPAGSLIANRGFGLTDRPSTLFGGLGRPPETFYHEIDHNPGYYAGITWRHHDRLEVRALRYDNLADPGATTAAGTSAWRTHFSTVGARLTPVAHCTFIAQYIDGRTLVGDDDADEAYEQFHLSFHTAFALASADFGHERLTARFDQFGTHQSNGSEGPPRDQSGHAWTAAWTHDFDDHWEAVAEWIHAWSRYPPRLTLGEQPSLIETQSQIAVRYRFRFVD